MGEVFGEKFCATISLQSFGSVQGTIDGKSFWFSPNVSKKAMDIFGAILASTKFQENKNVLDKIKPVISEIIGSVEPICRYDLLTTFVSYEKIDVKQENLLKHVCVQLSNGI